MLRVPRSRAQWSTWFSKDEGVNRRKVPYEQAHNHAVLSSRCRSAFLSGCIRLRREARGRNGLHGCTGGDSRGIGGVSSRTWLLGGEDPERDLLFWRSDARRGDRPDTTTTRLVQGRVAMPGPGAARQKFCVRGGLNARGS